MELYWLDAKRISAARDAALTSLVDGLASDPDDARIFRDPQGAYWYFECDKRQWHRYAGTTWAKEQDPPLRLEGSARWLAVAPNPLPGRPSEADLESCGAVDGLERSARRLAAAYAAGAAGSMTVEGFAQENFLVDRQGRIWQPGLRSGRWYAFEAGKWSEQPAAPPIETLCNPSAVLEECPGCGEALASGKFCGKCGAALPARESGGNAVFNSILDFLASNGGASTPEPVTPPWSPPADLPPEVVDGALVATAAGDSACLNCGASLPPGARFCVGCGTAIRSR